MLLKKFNRSSSVNCSFAFRGLLCLLHLVCLLLSLRDCYPGRKGPVQVCTTSLPVRGKSEYLAQSFSAPCIWDYMHSYLRFDDKSSYWLLGGSPTYKSQEGEGQVIDGLFPDSICAYMHRYLLVDDHSSGLPTWAIIQKKLWAKVNNVTDAVLNLWGCKV